MICGNKTTFSLPNMPVKETIANIIDHIYVQKRLTPISMKFIFK